MPLDCETESPTHTATWYKGILKVDRKAPPAPVMRKTEVSADGKVAETTIPASQLFSDTRFLSNVFTASYQGDGSYSCDINCGCQRWQGSQSGQAVSTALARCGFSPVQRRYILSQVRKAKYGRLARQF